MHVLARSGICVCVHACVDGWTGGRYRWMGGWTEGGVEVCVCVCARVDGWVDRVGTLEQGRLPRLPFCSAAVCTHLG